MARRRSRSHKPDRQMLKQRTNGVAEPLPGGPWRSGPDRSAAPKGARNRASGRRREGDGGWIYLRHRIMLPSASRAPMRTGWRSPLNRLCASRALHWLIALLHTSPLSAYIVRYSLQPRRAAQKPVARAASDQRQSTAVRFSARSTRAVASHCRAPRCGTCSPRSSGRSGQWRGLHQVRARHRRP